MRLPDSGLFEEGSACSGVGWGPFGAAVDLGAGVLHFAQNIGLAFLGQVPDDVVFLVHLTALK